MAGNGISGKGGDVLKGTGTPVQIAEIKKWSWTPKGGNPSYRSNKTAGYTARDSGYKDGGGSFDFVWDPTNPMTSQVDVTDKVTLNLQTLVGQTAVMPVVIDEIKLDVDIEAATIIGGTVSFSNNGAWTYGAAAAPLMGPMPGTAAAGAARQAMPAEAVRQAMPAGAARQAMPAAAGPRLADDIESRIVQRVTEAVLAALNQQGVNTPNGGRVIARAA